MEARARSSTQPNGTPSKRHLRNLLLDRRFQLRWALRVVLATALIVSIMGYFLYRTITDATQQLLAQKLGDPVLTEAAIDAFIKQADYDKFVTLSILIAGLVSLVLLLGGLTIIYTHKIAGPVYKMRQILASIRGDRLQLWAKLRRADELQEIFVDFDNMLRRLREQRRSDTAILKEIRARITAGDTEEKILDPLDKLIETYKKSVRMD
ncbi:MAG: hypothetical protein QNJ97_23875 [Myxococcota bacterium]|nr:hypothetical protein [Myxococcota bacterium]